MKELLATFLYFFCFVSYVSTIEAEEVDFNRDIRPLLNRHCTACHGGVKMAGEVSFVTRDTVLPPSGWVVKPGEPDVSLLIERVESSDPDIRMPPPEHGAALKAEEIQLLRRWIEQGAVWNEHWAYEKPLPQTVPEVTKKSWPLQDLDFFVLNRLEQNGVAPSPEENPERWLRRVTFDVIGLPPTLEERQRFLADFSQRQEAAYEAVVDRLLSSKGFGERWGSVWLDQVRYADSRGLGLDGPRNIWKYRDWVIDAYNNDMPYTDFTIKQIAGDLLPERTVDDRVATAIHRLTQTNEEGGTDDEEFRVAAVLDRVSTVWQTWQGVTFGCVQCHSHPYDPFQHEEFYQFAAFFNNTKDCDLEDDWPTIQAPIDSADVARASELDRKIESLRNELWHVENEAIFDESNWKPVVAFEATTNNDTRLAVESRGSHAEYHTVGTVSQETQVRLVSQLPSALEKLTAIRVTVLPCSDRRTGSLL
ncbi:MAG: DUF1549 domain-containing protein [Pirellula sp.]|nr:DUF1549 domain-containing protein [Pirellula sp.]